MELTKVRAVEIVVVILAVCTVVREVFELLSP